MVYFSWEQSHLQMRTGSPMTPRLSGMTGTAFTEAKEFEEVYKLKTVAGQRSWGSSWGGLTMSHLKISGFQEHPRTMWIFTCSMDDLPYGFTNCGMTQTSPFFQGSVGSNWGPPDFSIPVQSHPGGGASQLGQAQSEKNRWPKIWCVLW